MEDSQESSVEECMICSMPLHEQYCHKLDCGHTFHYECLLTCAIINRRHSSSQNTCPYCRTKHPFLPIVNGLSKNKIKPGIHYSFADNVPEYTVIKCQHILTRGKRKGELCNKNPQLGFTCCRVHNKVNLIHKDTTES